MGARTLSEGTPVPFFEQHRARWDRFLIERGISAFSGARRSAASRGPTCCKPTSPRVMPKPERPSIPIGDASSPSTTDWSPSFPVLSAIARHAFDDVDTMFFDRHGSRDDGHAGDASMLFAVSAYATHFAAAEHEVMIDLDLRCELNDAWLAACSGRQEAQRAGSLG